MTQYSDQFVAGVLKDLGITNPVAVQGMNYWLANEQGGPQLRTFDSNRGNPLGIQTPSAMQAGQSGDMATGIKLTAQELESQYPSIVSTLKTMTTPDQIANAVTSTPWNGARYGGSQQFLSVATGSGVPTQSSNVPLSTATASPASNSTPGSVSIPGSKFLPPEAGVNPKNFHGIDLTAIPANELGNAEAAVQKYITDPGYAQLIQQRMKGDFNYQVGWAQHDPQVMGVLIWASAFKDPTDAASKNEFETAMQNTTFWHTNDANQRAWSQALVTDPAQASQSLHNAREKVLADANQIGVTLTGQEINSIANYYASQTYQQSGSFGTQSGTAPEWLDQAVIDTVYNIKNKNAGALPSDFSTLASGQSTYNQQTDNGTNPNSLFGISSQLYDKFQTIAQQYLMYNPTNPNGSLINQKDLMSRVGTALQNYTGSGSSFGSSNLINGAVTQFTQEMKDQASKLYPSLAPSINQGTLPQDYVKPYTQVISSMMGINPASIDFTSPKWNWVIATPDAKTGVKSALTLDQVQRKLVTLPQWQQSNTAAQMGTDVVTALNRQFGFGGN